MEYYSDTTKNGILSFVTAWIELEITIKWNNPGTESQVLQNLTNIWNLNKLISMKLRVEW
jgi:hypothetical protein